MSPGIKIADTYSMDLFCGLHHRLAAEIDAAIAAEREACAALTDAWPEQQKYTSDRFTYGSQMATELADAIRART